MAKKQQFAFLSRNLLLVSFCALSLSACAGSDTIDLTNNRTVDEAIEAATGPLQDLNLRRQEIPPLLVKAAMNPYAPSPKARCSEIAEEVSQLDALLGADVQPKTITLAASDGGMVDYMSNLDNNLKVPETMALVNGAGKLAKDTVIGTIRSKTNILPFRNIIRSVTGANSHQKKLAAAYEAGKLRRAYLKGLAEVRFGTRCELKPVVVEAKVDERMGLLLELR
jgi:hypothetical protein